MMNKDKRRMIMVSLRLRNSKIRETIEGYGRERGVMEQVQPRKEMKPLKSPLPSSAKKAKSDKIVELKPKSHFVGQMKPRFISPCPTSHHRFASSKIKSRSPSTFPLKLVSLSTSFTSRENSTKMPQIEKKQPFSKATKLKNRVPKPQIDFVSRNLNDSIFRKEGASEQKSVYWEFSGKFRENFGPEKKSNFQRNIRLKSNDKYSSNQVYTEEAMNFIEDYFNRPSYSLIKLKQRKFINNF